MHSEPFLPRSFGMGVCWAGNDPGLWMLPGVPAQLGLKGTFSDIPWQQEFPGPESGFSASWSILPANAGNTRGGGLDLSEALFPCWRVRDRPDPAIWGDLSRGKPGKSGLSSGMALGRPQDGDSSVPGSTFAFLAPCRQKHGRDEPFSCFSWCLDARHCKPVPAGALRAPGGSSGSDSSGARGGFLQTPQNSCCLCR